jgi:hypothetical protein
MADRADYLARTMIARLTNLQASFDEDGRGEPDRQQRIEAIEKVLAVELGITDGTTLAVIETAVPNLKAARQAPDQEVATFADFLRRWLGPQLTES